MLLRPISFLAAVILVVIAQWGTVRAARHASRKQDQVGMRPWKNGRLLAGLVLIAVSLTSVLLAFLAFMSSFVGPWQLLWPSAAILAVTGLVGLTAAIGLIRE
jgi:hypothetical protein